MRCEIPSLYFTTGFCTKPNRREDNSAVSKLMVMLHIMYLRGVGGITSKPSRKEDFICSS